MAYTVFEESVRNVVSSIPLGETRTYKEVAILAGYPRAYRAVGSVLKKNYSPDVPCHRVVKSGGDIGEYNRGRDAKIQLLKKERAEAVKKYVV